MIAQQDFTGDDTSDDQNGHGTHVAGIVGSASDYLVGQLSYNYVPTPGIQYYYLVSQQAPGSLSLSLMLGLALIGRWLYPLLRGEA